MPVMGDPSHRNMVEFLERLAPGLPEYDEILVISAHWEAENATVYSEYNQKLLYDYYGFPEKTYQLKYPTISNNELTEILLESLHTSGIDADTDASRGLDHGVFIPLMLMYPSGGIPVTQLSLVRGLNAQKHIDLGRALKPLLDRNILIIGSGFSFHNMQHFNMRTDIEDEKNDQFQDWLIDTCSRMGSDNELFSRLAAWQDAPNARYCHPREEHLLPLHVCAGLGGTEAELIFDDYIAGKRSLAFRWQA